MNNTPAKKHYENKAGDDEKSPASPVPNKAKNKCHCEHKWWFIAAYVLLVIINIAGLF